MTAQVRSLKLKTTMVRLDQIVEPEFRLREVYDEDALRGLAASLQDDGLQAPLIVEGVSDDMFELVIGSRRFRAAKLGEFDEISCVVRKPGDPVNIFLLAMTENLQREDLDPFEEARGFIRLIREFGMKAKDVAAKLHINPSLVKRRLALLSLPESVQDMIASGALGLQFAQILAMLKTGEVQVYYARMVIDDRLTATELRARIAEDNEQEVQIPTRGKITAAKVKARILIQKRWLRKLTGKLNLNDLTPEERAEIADELNDLAVISQTTREIIANPKSTMAPSVGNTRPQAANHRQEWTTRDIARITASDRPSDEVLAQQLGRTPSAIAVMRSKIAKS